MGAMQDLCELLAVQTAVYWGNPADDGSGGFTYDNPEEIPVAWYGVTEVVTNAMGQEVVSKAKVIVTQDLDKRGILFLGTLEDLDSDEEDDPISISTAYRIIRADKIPGPLETNDFFRMVYL